MKIIKIAKAVLVRHGPHKTLKNLQVYSEIKYIIQMNIELKYFTICRSKVIGK